MASLNSQFPDVRVIGEEGQALQDDVDPDWIVTSQCSYVHSQVNVSSMHQSIIEWSLLENICRILCTYCKIDPTRFIQKSYISDRRVT